MSHARGLQYTMLPDSATIYRLPDSILVDILSRLPTKIVFQLKCVSKRLHSFISGPDFTQFYISTMSTPPQTTLFLRSVVSPKHNFFDFNSNFVGVKIENSGRRKLLSTLIANGLHPKPVEIVGFCDGLLICTDARQIVYYIFNPITRDIVSIPPSPYPCQSIGCGLICQLEGGIVKSYCLVLIQIVVDSVDALTFQVYSSESDEWRVVKGFFPGQLNSFFTEYSLSTAFSYKGMLHWVHLAHGVIIVYDPLNDPTQCRFIDLPGEKRQYDMFNRVCNVCEGCLRYLEVEKLVIWRNTFPRVRVWVLSDHEKGEWVLEHLVAGSVRVDGFLERYVQSVLGMHIVPLAFNPMDKDVIYLWYAFSIFSYNVRSKQVGAEVEYYSGKLLCYKDVIPFVFPPLPSSIPKAYK